MIHVFFGEREVAKIPDITKETPTREIKGSSRRRGHDGRRDRYGLRQRWHSGASEGSVAGVSRPRPRDDQEELCELGKKGRFSQEVMDRRMGLITPSLTYDGFEDVDIVVEAVFEGMELKSRSLATSTDLQAEAILASNTSTLNIDEIASVTSRPQSVIGHHFFSPANVMRLLEIVRGKESSEEVVATSMALARRLNKVGVLVGNCRGFVGNRMLAPYGREAQFLVEEGARSRRLMEHSTISGWRWECWRWETLRDSTSAGGFEKSSDTWRSRGSAADDRRPPLRDGPLRAEDRRRLVPLR